MADFFSLHSGAIFFDGLLPLSKKETRLSRLQNYANQLVNFKALHKEDLPPRMAHTSSVSSAKFDVLSAVVSSNKLKALPAPTFLVPAVIEALFESRYSHLVKVIPGEADAYCADAARQTGGIIFTSDSDLLVHDLGETGKVVLFRDLESIHLPSRGKCLKIQQYHPAGIAKKFGLPDLVNLAFFMSEDHHKSFAENVKLAAKNIPSPAAFAEFAEQYGSLPRLSKLAMEEDIKGTNLSQRLSRLDPRISEIVHLVRLKGDHEARSALPETNTSTLEMYLPFILDDPTRSSAWRSGVDIRTEAYSLLRLLNPTITQVMEYDRKGTRIAGTDVILLDSCDLLNVLQERSMAWQKDIAQHQMMSKAARWRTIAMKLVCQSNIDNDKPLPSSSDINRLVTASQEGVLSWSFIHAGAQMQASLYSLRILSQISLVVCDLLQRDAKEVPGPLREITRLLDQLPTLRDLLDGSTTKVNGEAEAARTAVLDTLQGFGITQDSETPSKKKKKRKKKGEHTGDRTPPGVVWRGNNIFSNLV